VLNAPTPPAPAGEDDAAFWSRLIPEDQRPQKQAEVVSTMLCLLCLLCVGCLLRAVPAGAGCRLRLCL